MQTAAIPGRNPLKYCRLCLSQVNILTVLTETDCGSATSPHKLLLQKLFHYAKVTFMESEDFPSAICGCCVSQLNDFHEFRRIVVRNHNMVRHFRRMHEDEFDSIKLEEGETLVDIIDEPQFVRIKQEENVDGVPEVVPIPLEDVIKDVDVYHMDGELRTVVVKPEKVSPTRVLPQVKDQIPNGDVKSSRVTILNKTAAPPIVPKRPLGTLLNTGHQEKRIKTFPAGNTFSIVKCSQCKAVFRNRENLIIHENNDHRGVEKKSLPMKMPVTVAPHIRKPLTRTVAPPKPTHTAVVPPRPTHVTTNISQSRPGPPLPKQVQRVTLYKCPQCSSSFIQETNFEQHLKTCKVAALAKLNTSQITIKRSRVSTESNQPASAGGTIGAAQKPRSVRRPEEEEDRIRCNYCPLSYKTKHFLVKHQQDVHKIVNEEEEYFCPICKLNYSCSEDLQLHNRALHRFHCTKCKGDYRTCMHAQEIVKVEEEEYYDNKQDAE